VDAGIASITVFFGFGISIITILYGAFIQGSGALFVRNAKWFGIVVYIVLAGLVAMLYESTFEKTSLHPQTIENIRALAITILFGLSYGIIGLLWSTLSVKISGSFPKLTYPKRKRVEA
jgi:hypothetical protein